MIGFTNSTGNLFNRLGKDAKAIDQADTYQSSTMATYVSGISGQYLTRPDLVPTLQTSLTNGQGAAQQIKGDISTIASNTVIKMVQEDAPQPAATLNYALPELIAQMKSASATVKKNIVSASVAAGSSNIGNGACIVSVIDGTGTTLENVYAETITITCVNDSQPGSGVTAGQEGFMAQGTPSVSKLSFNWPKGSGGQTSITSASAAFSGSTLNAITNGNFELFTVANTPNSWTIATGTAGTTVFSTATAYIGSKALSITGNGSELTKLTQNLRSTATSVNGVLAPQTKYVLAFYVRVSAVPSGGVLRVSLQDGSNAVIASSNVSVTLSAATTSYVLKTVVFNTPLNLPSTINAVIELTTALDNAKSVYVDELVVTQMVQHQNGPFFAIIPGSTNFVREDVFSVTVSNDYGGQFQTFFNRVFNMDSLGLVLPSATSGSETISDTLIS